jgi:hypothetical protein
MLLANDTENGCRTAGAGHAPPPASPDPPQAGRPRGRACSHPGPPRRRAPRRGPRGTGRQTMPDSPGSGSPKCGGRSIDSLLDRLGAPARRAAFLAGTGAGTASDGAGQTSHHARPTLNVKAGRPGMQHRRGEPGPAPRPRCWPQRRSPFAMVLPAPCAPPPDRRVCSISTAAMSSVLPNPGRLNPENTRHTQTGGPELATPLRTSLRVPLPTPRQTPGRPRPDTGVASACSAPPAARVGRLTHERVR